MDYTNDLSVAPAFADRVVHDDLEIGTAVMAMEALMED